MRAQDVLLLFIHRCHDDGGFVYVQTNKARRSLRGRCHLTSSFRFGNTRADTRWDLGRERSGQVAIIHRYEFSTLRALSG